MECAHSICTCQVASEEFCSDHCRSTAGTAMSMGGTALEPADSMAQDCGCGHDACIARSGPGTLT